MSAQYSQHSTLSNFIPLGKIGMGSFSSVYKVRRITDNQIYALKKIKLMSLKQRQKNNALNEVRILASLNCQNIIGYKEAFFDQKLKLLCVVMEWADGGDLQKKIQNHRNQLTYFSQQQIWKAIKHILTGLKILHKKAILHRDIKSANIFINDDVYKLGDLNVSKIQSEQSQLAYTQTGTPTYASPQVWRDQPYNYKSDIWSFGCVIYEMCCLKVPFKGRDLDQLYKKIQKGVYSPIPNMYSQNLKYLIGSCLKMNPQERPKIQQLLSSFQTNLINNQISSEQNNKLLSTIQFSKDLKGLNFQLPKSKYREQQQQNPQINENKQKSSSIKIQKNLDRYYKQKIQPRRLSFQKINQNYQLFINQKSQKNKLLLKQIKSLKNLKQNIQPVPQICKSQRYQSQKNLNQICSITQRKRKQLYQYNNYLISNRKKLFQKNRSLKNLNILKIINQQKCLSINKKLNISKQLLQPIKQSPVSTQPQQNILIKDKYVNERYLKQINKSQSKLKKISSVPYISPHISKIQQILNIQSKYNKNNNNNYLYPKLNCKKYLAIKR